jgi:hypothetical protein
MLLADTHISIKEQAEWFTTGTTLYATTSLAHFHPFVLGSAAGTVLTACSSMMCRSQLGI